jgi:hypothetical protein
MIVFGPAWATGAMSSHRLRFTGATADHKRLHRPPKEMSVDGWIFIRERLSEADRISRSESS